MGKVREMHKDSWGYNLSGATQNTVARYEQALAELRCYVNDPVATIDAALIEAPEFVMAHALKAYLFLAGTEPAGIPVARASRDQMKSLKADDRELRHGAAIQALLDGEYDVAVERLEDILINYPHDLLALQIGHLFDFFRGDWRNLRDRVARVRPHWSHDHPGAHAVLGMHAFGLEESGNYAAAEEAGRTAIELEPRDTWAHHAVAHVMEMQGRIDDGIQWMTTRETHWATNSFFAVHNWWHLALFNLDRGEPQKALALYDEQIRGTKSALALDMIDASAMLWRLHLRGVDVGNRWTELADSWAPMVSEGFYAFNDFHAAMAFIGAGRWDLMETGLKTLRQRLAERGGSNQAMIRDVGLPGCEALVAFGKGDYQRAITLLRPLRTLAPRFGGSHAQRDVFDLTLIEAATRARDVALVRALANERMALKPASPLAARYLNAATAKAA